MTPSSRDSRLKVVIDSNLFVSGSIIRSENPYQLLEAWRSGAFRLVIYDDQIGELHDVFDRPKLAGRLTPEAILRLFTRLFAESLASSPVRSSIHVRDQKDRKILAAALGDNADYLVTGDLDLLMLDGDSRLGNLRIVTARDFLEILEDEPRKSS